MSLPRPAGSTRRFASRRLPALTLMLAVLTLAACSGPSTIPPSGATAPTPSPSRLPTQPAARHEPQPAPPATSVRPTGSASGSARPTVSAAPATSPPPDAATELGRNVAIAYADGAALWLIDGNSPPRQVARGSGLGFPLLSPNRSWIAYRQITSGAGELWAASWDGSDAHKVFADTDLPKNDLPAASRGRMIERLRWQPASSRLLFTTASPPTSGGPALPFDDLWMVEVYSKVLKEVLPAGKGGYFVLSPDAQTLALTRPGTAGATSGVLVVANSDGANARTILDFPALSTNNQRGFYPRPVWTPDSTGLFVAIPDAGTPTSVAGSSVYRVAGAGKAEKIGHVDAVDIDERNWSPNRRRLAYSRPSGSADLNQYELVIADPDGSHGDAYGKGQFLSWSPDSTHFIYRDGPQAFLGAAGQAPQLLGSEDQFREARWASSQQFIYLAPATAEGGRTQDLVLRTLDGQTRTLAHFAPHTATPAEAQITFDVIR